jgi:hypothetical protein
MTKLERLKKRMDLADAEWTGIDRSMRRIEKAVRAIGNRLNEKSWRKWGAAEKAYLKAGGFDSKAAK